MVTWSSVTRKRQRQCVLILVSWVEGVILDISKGSKVQGELVSAAQNSTREAVEPASNGWFEEGCRWTLTTVLSAAEGISLIASHASWFKT